VAEGLAAPERQAADSESTTTLTRPDRARRPRCRPDRRPSDHSRLPRACQIISCSGGDLSRSVHLTIARHVEKSVWPEKAAATDVVLVHGEFVDGSGWQAVHAALRRKGYRVSDVQSPTLSLADDVAATKRTMAAISGPVVLVGHSYGGW